MSARTLLARDQWRLLRLHFLHGRLFVAGKEHSECHGSEWTAQLLGVSFFTEDGCRGNGKDCPDCLASGANRGYHGTPAHAVVLPLMGTSARAV